MRGSNYEEELAESVVWRNEGTYNSHIIVIDAIGGISNKNTILCKDEVVANTREDEKVDAGKN